MASIRKQRGKWQVRFRSPDGKQRSQSFTAKRDADRFRVSVESSLQTDTWIDPQVGKTTTVSDMCDLWWKRVGPQRRPATQQAYESALKLHVKPKLGRYPLTAVKADAVMAWVADLEAAGVGPHSVRRAYQLLDRVFAMAVRLGMINSNPVPNGLEERPHAPKTKPTRFLTMEQVDLLAEKIDPAFRTWLLTAAYSGLRFGELAGLRVLDVDPLHAVLHVRQQLSEVGGHVSFAPPKTEAGRRTIDLPKFLLPLLEAQAAGKAPDSLMFTAEHGGPLRRSNFLSRVWKPAVERAEIEACTPHSLRHSYASWLAAQGVPAHELAGALGHTKPSTTLDLYSHVMPHRRRAAADALDEMRAQIEPVTAIR
jgi:integrase